MNRKVGNVLKSEELAIIVEENMDKVQVGDLYANERKLYSALSIPKDSDAKMTQKVVGGYFNWEKTGSLNKNKKVSKEIRITKVNKHFHYTDGRKNNGGAHNITYGPIIKPALVNYEYGEFITYRQIDKKIYGFKKFELESYHRKDDKYVPDNKHEIAYKDQLYNYLKSITETALDGINPLHTPAILIPEVMSFPILDNRGRVYGLD